MLFRSKEIQNDNNEALDVATTRLEKYRIAQIDARQQLQEFRDRIKELEIDNDSLRQYKEDMTKTNVPKMNEILVRNRQLYVAERKKTEDLQEKYDALQAEVEQLRQRRDTVVSPGISTSPAQPRGSPLTIADLSTDTPELDRSALMNAAIIALSQSLSVLLNDLGVRSSSLSESFRGKSAADVTDEDVRQFKENLKSMADGIESTTLPDDVDVYDLDRTIATVADVEFPYLKDELNTLLDILRQKRQQQLVLSGADSSARTDETTESEVSPEPVNNRVQSLRRQRLNIRNVIRSSSPKPTPRRIIKAVSESTTPEPSPAKASTETFVGPIQYVSALAKDATPSRAPIESRPSSPQITSSELQKEREDASQTAADRQQIRPIDTDLGTAQPRRPTRAAKGNGSKEQPYKRALEWKKTSEANVEGYYSFPTEVKGERVIKYWNGSAWVDAESMSTTSSAVASK